jgi:hypothetical protein
MDRNGALALPAVDRLRWFSLRRVGHRELNAVTAQVKQLLEPHNDTKIVSVVGMPSIGKTTLAESLSEVLLGSNGPEIHSSEMPLLYARTPANGDKALSWVGFYTAVLESGQEMLLSKKRDAVAVSGRLELIRCSRATLGVRPTLRRAAIITGSKWLPSQLPSVLLMEIRRAIGESKIRKPLKALNLGVALQSEIAKAASRIVVAVAANRYQLH